LRPDYRDVTNETLKFIWNNMTEVMKEDDFFLLPADIMQMLMSGSIINVADEGVLLCVSAILTIRATIECPEFTVGISLPGYYPLDIS